MVKNWIRERAQTVFTDGVKIDYIGGDPRFIVDHTYQITCKQDDGSSKVNTIVETSDETPIKTFTSEQIEEFLKNNFIEPKDDRAASQDVTPDL